MNRFNTDRNARQLQGALAKQGYVRWWHSFRGKEALSGQVRTFFVEYFVINPGLGNSKPILGQLPGNKKRGIKSSYCMIKAGVLPDEEGEEAKTLCVYYGLGSYKATGTPMHLFVGNNECSETYIRGDIYASHSNSNNPYLHTDSGSMEWNLEISKAIACNTGILGSNFAEKLGLFGNYWHGEGIKTYFRGFVILDGIRYEVDCDESYGYSDKHWGRNLNSPLLLLSSCNLYSEKCQKFLKNSALAIDGCVPKFIFLPLPKKLLIQLTYTGEDFEYGFCNPANPSKCKWKIKNTNKRDSFRIYAENKNSLIKISGFTLRSDIKKLPYENPGNGTTIGVNVGGNGIGTIELYRKGDKDYELIDTIHIKNALWQYSKN